LAALSHSLEAESAIWKSIYLQRSCNAGSVAPWASASRERRLGALAVTANAGHPSYSTTKRYVKLAGVVFPDAAAACERRLPNSKERNEAEARISGAA
jgi:hypothetical protein